MSLFDSSDPTKSGPKCTSLPHPHAHSMSKEQTERANTVLDRIAQGIERVKDRIGGCEMLERAEERLMDKKADLNHEPAINQTVRRGYRHGEG
jgi:hypothetical protein